MASQPPDAVVLIDDPTAGGGWGGANANNDKIAFMAGALKADPPLPGDVPPPGVVTWGDGSRQSAELISAADALNRMVAEQAQAKCGSDCTTVVVTGAHLTTDDRYTTRGSADLPVWQFEFKPEDQPIDPITYVAVKDASWFGGGDAGPGDQTAYGNAQRKSLTVAFFGAPHAGDNPCGADYSAEAVESGFAVVVVITESHRVSPIGAACLGDAALRTAVATLGQPLGNRFVLNIDTESPMKVVDATPPPDSATN